MLAIYHVASPYSLGDDLIWEGIHLHGQTPTVEVRSDVFLSQSLQQILGKTPEQTAGVGHCRMETCTSEKLVESWQLKQVLSSLQGNSRLATENLH